MGEEVWRIRRAWKLVRDNEEEEETPRTKKKRDI